MTVFQSADDDDGATGVEDEFDIYEDLNLDGFTPGVPAIVAITTSASSQGSKESASLKTEISISDQNDGGLSDTANTVEERNASIDVAGGQFWRFYFDVILA